MCLSNIIITLAEYLLYTAIDKLNKRYNITMFSVNSVHVLLTYFYKVILHNNYNK